jgi:hypothetical protein
MATTKINNFYRGDTVSYAMTFTTNSVAMDITGATIWFTLKKSRNDTDAQAVLQKELTSHSDPTHGITTMSLTSTDTNIPCGRYFYDFQVKTLSGNIFTFLSGTVDVLEDVTRSTS